MCVGHDGRSATAGCFATRPRATPPRRTATAGAAPCAADAFYAPVVSRFYSYDTALPADLPLAAAYMRTVLAEPAYREWASAAAAERAAGVGAIGHYDAMPAGRTARADGEGLWE